MLEVELKMRRVDKGSIEDVEAGVLLAKECQHCKQEGVKRSQFLSWKVHKVTYS